MSKQEFEEPRSDLMKVRIEKLGRLRERGLNPYPHSFPRTHTTRQARDLLLEVEDHSPDSARTESVSVAGRMLALRSMGRAAFADISDGHGRMQILLRRNELGESYGLLDDLDIGDWVGVGGHVMRTRAGEVTVEATSLTMLAKSLRPLPEKWHGLTDTEIRFRQRYLDLIVSEEARRVATLRSSAVSAMRRFLDGRGFVEVETPVLVSVAAGAMARPFVTHHNQLHSDLYLRIATELYLKRLIVGGLERVYEIGQPRVHDDGELPGLCRLQGCDGDGRGDGRLHSHAGPRKHPA